MTKKEQYEKLEKDKIKIQKDIKKAEKWLTNARKKIIIINDKQLNLLQYKMFE